MTSIMTIKCRYGWLVIVSLFALVSGDELREGFFNSSAFVRLSTPVSLQGHIGLSFKSCSGGELFSQHTNGNSVSLLVQQDGLAFVASVFGRHIEVRLPSRLLDNAWHSVNLIYRLGNLTLYAGGHQQVVANKSLNPEILLPDLLGKSSVLTVGNGFHGCILEGPSLVLEQSNLLQSVNVAWGPCPLKSLGCSKLDMCFYDPCMNHGTCMSYPDRYECMCAPRFSGTNCEIDNGSVCDRKPCKNNGQCKEDGEGNFSCICDVAHTGTLCELTSNAQPCQINPCANNGTCRLSSLFPDRPECICPPGFRGPLCDVNINECQSNPCKNGGTCLDGDNSYTCICGRSGYKGEHCDVNVDECEAINPCLNQGTCFDNYGGYTCQCPTGFAGQNCELNLNECSSGPCMHGGSCEDQVGSYVCHCKAGYIGANCEMLGSATAMSSMSVLPASCKSSPPPCGPDYDCVDTASSYNCVCKPGFVGVPPNCTQAVALSACPVNNCLNGGTCLVTADGNTCNCAPGFTGKTCNVPLNECDSSPCEAGGSCMSRAGTPGFVCRCPDHRVGARCERAEPSPCASQPCLNRGVCVAASAGDYRCECAPGFTGDSCATEEEACADGECPTKSTKSLAGACSASPCNNGTCHVVDQGSYSCECGNNMTGDHCELDIDECQNPTICNNGVCINMWGGYQCFCRPGYAGDNCDFDIDECLSHPCQNNATCENRINTFFCNCQPGYSGRVCAVDVDECASNPCTNGGTCNDHVNGFTCTCPPGLTGLYCQINIDDCVSQPCQHGGMCIDGINSYRCDCNDTGFEGWHCESNIDDCRENPCENGANCVDLVKGYRCDCYPGYNGENCQNDIDECEDSPCKNGGSCYERSNKELYDLSNSSLPSFFNKKFNLSQASGYECLCVPGIIGTNCEKEIDECESNPCSIHGNCKDLVGGYLCECHPGYEGDFCELDINECDKYQPCDKGQCEDRRNDYYCHCENGYGGKNCSVLLTGCNENKCQNSGRCSPYLENETEHKFNCSCASGFRGQVCEKVTTMSLRGSSHVTIRKSREEGYDISFKLKTTLPSGLLAIGEGLTYYMLLLQNGRLNLRSSLLNRIEGVSAGSGLNDSKWQRVFVAINSSHLVLGANEEQTIYPITLTEANTSHTSFMTTYLGGTVSSLVRLANGPAFVGCMEDVVVNGEWIIPQDEAVSPFNLTDIEEGCLREEQCNPNLCQSGGECTDLWRTFSCTCVRPFLGHTCQYNYTPATFGYENVSDSLVTVQVNEAALQSFRSVVDISMFIRTRQERGFIFYLGSLPGGVTLVPSNRTPKETFITAELEGGELRVNIQFGSSREAYSVGGTRLDNGYSHLIQVVRNGTLVAVRINGTENFRKTISPQEPLIANVLYLGGMPLTNQTQQQMQQTHNESPVEVTLPPRRVSRQIEAPPRAAADVPASVRPFDNFVHFKGVIQDVQVSNGTRVMVVEFFPLKLKDLTVPTSFGNVSFDSNKVLSGEVSDDTCRCNPCLHDGNCTVTWNDYACDCPPGYKGKSCEDMEFCQVQDCPAGSECRNLENGYECVTNVTLRGTDADLMRYKYVGGNNDLDSVRVNYRSHVGGTILHLSQGDFYFSVSAFLNETTVSWRLDNSTGQQQRFSRRSPDDDWVSIFLEMRNDALNGGYSDIDQVEFSIPNFPVDTWKHMVRSGSIVIGGLDADLEKPITVSPRLAYVVDTMESSGNAINLPHSSFDPDGRYFKGCLGIIRIGGLLLPYFTPDLIYNDNFTATSYFALSAIPAPLANVTGCVLCFPDECFNGGVCENPAETHRCNCTVGYERDDCSKDIDWCRGAQQCANNATCVDGIANFTCSCVPGFTGPLCEVNIDECASNPCVHGTCTDQINGYTCQCQESFIGTNCELFKIVTCADEPCKNESTCVDGFNSKTMDNFTCNCAEGFVDRFCNIPYCEAKPCGNRGRCEVVGRPQCVCVAGYEGPYCEVDTDDCAPDPCAHNGKCTDLVNGYSCDCTETGYQGSSCSEDVDECAMHTDLCGDGVCNNTEGSYKCVCNPRGDMPMCGYTCNIPDPCSAGPVCDNGGTCVEACTHVPLFTCLCPPEFTGHNCSEKIVSSGPSPTDVAIIVGPIVAFLVLAGGVGLTVFLMMARKKRATRGTYSPSQQEYCNPRVEMDNVLKPPPEERLI